MVEKKPRNRIYVHYGPICEILVSFSKFGLGSNDMLPTVFGGDL